MTESLPIASGLATETQVSGTLAYTYCYFYCFMFQVLAFLCVFLLSWVFSPFLERLVFDFQGNYFGLGPPGFLSCECGDFLDTHESFYLSAHVCFHDRQFAGGDFFDTHESYLYVCSRSFP